MKFNADGPQGLIDHSSRVAAISRLDYRLGPIPAIHRVLWRIVDRQSGAATTRLPGDDV
jgi:hypothetical protein